MLQRIAASGSSQRSKRGFCMCANQHWRRHSSRWATPATYACGLYAETRPKSQCLVAAQCRQSVAWTHISMANSILLCVVASDDIFLFRLTVKIILTRLYLQYGLFCTVLFTFAILTRPYFLQDLVGAASVSVSIAIALYSRRDDDSASAAAAAGLAGAYSLLLPTYLAHLAKCRADLDLQLASVERLHVDSKVLQENYRDDC